MCSFFVCPCRCCQLWTFCSLHKSTALRKCILMHMKINAQPPQFLHTLKSSLLLPQFLFFNFPICPLFFNSLNLAACLSKSSSSLQCEAGHWWIYNTGSRDYTYTYILWVYWYLLFSSKKWNLCSEMHRVFVGGGRATCTLLFPLTANRPQLRDNRADAEWPPQSYCVSSASHHWPHQGLPLSDSPRWAATFTYY